MHTLISSISALALTRDKCHCSTHAPIALCLVQCCLTRCLAFHLLPNRLWTQNTVAQHTDMPRPLHWHLHFEHAQPRTSAQQHLLSKALALSLQQLLHNPIQQIWSFGSKHRHRYTSWRRSYGGTILFHITTSDRHTRAPSLQHS